MKIYKFFEEYELCRYLYEFGNNEKNNKVLFFLNKKGCSFLYIDYYENFDWNVRNYWELVKVKIYRFIKKIWYFFIVFKELLNIVNELLMVIYY